MFEVLPASAAPLALRPRWVTASVVTHSILVATAVLATRAALEAPRETIADPTILMFVPKPPPPAPPPAQPEPEQAKLVIAEPPPKGFQTVALLQDIPKEIPPVDLKERALDPRDFTGRGVEGGLAAGVVGATATVNVFDKGPDEIYEATTADAGFTPAVLISEPAPQYPAQLQSVGVTGRVVLEFVIDTTGRVEAGSIRKIESTHIAFEQAARVTIAAARFQPARHSTRAVRQLTRQSIRFVASE